MIDPNCEICEGTGIVEVHNGQWPTGDERFDDTPCLCNALWVHTGPMDPQELIDILTEFKAMGKPYTMEDVAEQLGVTKMSIHNWKQGNGKRGIPQPVALTLRYLLLNYQLGDNPIDQQMVLVSLNERLTYCIDNKRRRVKDFKEMQAIIEPYL